MTSENDAQGATNMLGDADSEYIAISAIQALINARIVKPEGKTRAEIAREVMRYFSNNDEFPVTIDYTPDLLKQARFYKRRKDGLNEELACVFYALWFEHQINKIVSISCNENGLTLEESEMAIREMSYRVKFTVLLKLLGLDPIKEEHLKNINRIMEIRNYFVHYKWKVLNEQREKEMEAVLGDIERTVRYLNNYQEKKLGQITYRKTKNMLENKRD